jgi:hypothetical protein
MPRVREDNSEDGGSDEGDQGAGGQGGFGGDGDIEDGQGDPLVDSNPVCIRGKESLKDSSPALPSSTDPLHRDQRSHRPRLRFRERK